MKKILKTDTPEQVADNVVDDNLTDYPFYPESEDIYNKFKKENSLYIDEASKETKSGKSDNDRTITAIENADSSYGGNLDIPGSELDDEQENIGNEDEENNYYSIGGDNHNDLDEDKDELY